MTNEMSNVPELRFPEFDGEWEEKTIGKIATTFSGGTPTSTNRSYYNGEIPFIRSGEISKSSTELMINKEAISNSSAKMVEKGDLLYALYGATSGEVAISKINGAINQAVLCIRSQESATYIFNYLKMKKDQILKTYIQGGQGNLSASIIKKVDINLPYIEEQQKIGGFFSKLDRQIELEEQKLEKLEEQKKGYMQQIFSHQLIFKDKNGAIYPEWKTLKIKDIAEILRGLTYKPKDIRVAGIRVLRSSNIIKDKFHTYKDDIFVDESVVKTPLVNKGDILITAANGSPKLVGKHAIIEKLDDESVAGGFMYILRSDNSKFIQIWMSTVEYKRIISRVQGGNGSIGNLSRKDLENGYITLPCDEEQNKIGSFFNKFDELIEKQNKKIDGLKERKKGFLQKMFV